MLAVLGEWAPAQVCICKFWCILSGFLKKTMDFYPKRLVSSMDYQCLDLGMLLFKTSERCIDKFQIPVGCFASSIYLFHQGFDSLLYNVQTSAMYSSNFPCHLQSLIWSWLDSYPNHQCTLLHKLHDMLPYFMSGASLAASQSSLLSCGHIISLFAIKQLVYRCVQM